MKIDKTSIEVERLVKTKEDGFVVELTYEEAKIIADILGLVSGGKMHGKVTEMARAFRTYTNSSYATNYFCGTLNAKE